MKKKTRDQIVEVADKLFYQQGFEHTSFADIADEVEISRGNFYHHFKSKDEILNAVIELRLSKTKKLLDKWEQDGKRPEDRIKCFINILVMNMAKIKNFGCPVGTLCSELAKLDHPQLKDANTLFTLFREWLKKQFSLLGLKSQADDLAMHLLARSQGVATLGQAFHSEGFILKEVDVLHEWLKSLMEAHQ